MAKKELHAKAGDNVVLKMYVEEILNNEGKIKCFWHNAKGNKEYGIFDKDLLENYTDAKPIEEIEINDKVGLKMTVENFPVERGKVNCYWTTKENIKSEILTLDIESLEDYSEAPPLGFMA